MSATEVDTIVIGAGQAGIATSEHLSANGIKHVVFERDRIAESWRTRRWDSLVANGPAWHDRFPALDFKEHSGEAFVPKDAVVSYFEDYVTHIKAPVKCGVDVTHVTRNSACGGFDVTTTTGPYRARHIVAATGALSNTGYTPNNSWGHGASADTFRRLSQSRTTARGRRFGCWRRIIGGSNCPRTNGKRAQNLHFY